MELETLRKANSIREDIACTQVTLEKIDKAIEQTGGECPVFTELRAGCWNEKISIGSLLSGNEILSVYRERLVAKIKCLEAEFAAL